MRLSYSACEPAQTTTTVDVLYATVTSSRYKLPFTLNMTLLPLKKLAEEYRSLMSCGDFHVASSASDNQCSIHDNASVCLVQNAVKTPRPTTFMYVSPRNALYTQSYHGGNYTL